MLWMLTLALAAPPSSGPSHIVGGELSSDGSWPSVAALYNNSRMSCTGTLIAPDLVLTAGHCGTHLDEVVLDSSDLDHPGETITIAEMYRYPSHLDTLDLAVAVLEQPAITAPTPILRGCLLDNLSDGMTGDLVGFGAHDNYGRTFDGLLREAQVPITDVACEDTERGCGEQVMPAGEALAGGDGIDSCSGDSGGPLFVRLGDETFLFGVTSRASLPASQPCGGGGIYTRADAALAWLEDVTGFVPDIAECTVEAPNTAPRVLLPAATVRSGQTVTIGLQVQDSEGDVVTIDISRAPSDGELHWDGDSLRYTAPDGIEGELTYEITATDSGAPPLSTRATGVLQLSLPPVHDTDDPDTEVSDTSPPDTDGPDTGTGRAIDSGTPAPASCACSSSGTPALPLLALGLLPWWRRRR